MREQPEIYDIKFLKGFIRRRKKIFFVVSSVLFAATLVFAYLSAAKVYVSSATFLIEGKTPEEMLKGVTTSYVEERLQSITQQILSRDKLTEIIRQYQLYRSPVDQEGMENAIKQMREDIVVRTIKAEDLDKRPSRSRLTTVAFTLSYQGKDAQTVQQVASRLADLYVEKNEQTQEQLAAQAAAVLQQKMQQIKEQSEIAEQKLIDFKRQHAGELSESMSVNVDQIRRMNAQLDELNAKIAILEYKSTGAESQFSLPAGQNAAGAGQPANAPWTHLAQLKMQLVNLQSKYSDKHPDVIKTKKEIQQMEEKLGVTNSRGAGNYRDSELKKYKMQREAIENKIAGLSRRSQVAPLVQAEYNRLFADYDGAMRQYNEAKMKLAEAKAVKRIDETQLGERFIIIDKPIVPQNPENPKHTKIVLAGLFLSIFCGLFASVLTENLDHSIKSAEHLQKMTRLPVLTVVPLIKNDEEKQKSAVQQMLQRVEEFKNKAFHVISKEKGS